MSSWPLVGPRAGFGLLLALLLVVLAAGGCASSKSRAPRPPQGDGMFHTVRKGETVWRISRSYGVTVDAVTSANRIRDVRRVQVGQRLWIPGARGLEGTGSGTPGALGGVWRGEGERTAQPTSATRPAPPPRPDTGSLGVLWPVEGRVSSRYGPRWGRVHEGIDIAAKTGTPVRAAESGRVIYSGSGLGAYGNVLILKHEGRYSTVYAHNRRNRVKKGDFVERGQVIALVGATGNATGPHLHFEVRRGRRAVDPSSVLP